MDNLKNSEKRKSSFIISKSGKSHCTVAVGVNATDAEMHSAKELIKYVEKISGCIMPLLYENDGRINEFDYKVLIGTGETSGLIKSFIDNGNFILSDEKPGLDGFAVKTIGNCLVLGGSNKRGTIYSVYHLLETYMKVGFFWDGDSIHKNCDIILPEIDLFERPAFRYRYSKSASECNAEYNYTHWWEFDEWKNEIDWMMKNKINVFVMNSGKPYVLKLVFEELGLPHDPIIEEDKIRMIITKEIFEYCNMLGIETVNSLPPIEVSHEILKKHPELDYYSAKWSDTSEDSPEGPPVYLFPWDALGKKILAEYTRIWRQTYGTTNMFVGTTPCESEVFLDDRQKIGEIFSSAPKHQYEALKSGYEDATIIFDGWIMRYSPQHVWDIDGVLKDFIDNMPEEKSILLDLWPEWRLGGPLINEKKFKYIKNRKFILTFLNEFGGNDYLHGCYKTMIDAVKNLTVNEYAKNCVGVGNSTEVMYFNVNYYDLMFRLAWNPNTITRDEFIYAQAERRYGPELLDDTKDAFKLLIDAVHSGQVTSEAYYQRRILLHSYGYRSMPRARSRESICRLEKYFTKAIPFPEAGRKSQFLQQDVYDAMRQYITELTNLHIYAMHDAYLVKNITEFDKHAEILSFLMDQLEALTKTNKRWHVDDMAAKLAGHTADDAKYYHIKTKAEISKFIRDKGLTFAVFCPEGLLDYPGKDCYELIKNYYRPRVDAFIDFIREVINDVEEPNIEREEINLKKIYRPIEIKWVEEGYPESDIVDNPEPIWKVAEAVYIAIKSCPGIKEYEEYK